MAALWLKETQGCSWGKMQRMALISEADGAAALKTWTYEFFKGEFDSWEDSNLGDVNQEPE